MNRAATQIASREFDADFFRLPQSIQALVQIKIDSMSLRLDSFPHYRMTGSDKYRLRVGDYRVIYHFNAVRGEIYLLAIGNRREIYRK
jgi:mRNA-degrading endonuclease RelE of RelBE toxin-antitoxin system